MTVLWDICNIKHRLCFIYSSQNIFNAKNFNPHKKPIVLLNMATFSQSMQRTWWPVASTTIVTGSYSTSRHDDVIKWKHFPRYWPFVRGIHRWPMDSPHKASDAERWCLFYRRLNKWLSKQSWGWWFETPSRSLWRHRNGFAIVVVRLSIIFLFDVMMTPYNPIRLYHWVDLVCM